MLKLFAALVAITGLVWVTGCNTVQGVGKDIQALGNAIDRAVHR